jgi:hypothetical protein
LHSDSFEATMQQQQKRRLRSSTHPNAAAAVATTDDETDRSHSELSSGDSDHDGSSHAELAIQGAQAQRRKRHTDAGSNGNAGSKRRKVGSSSSAAVNEEPRKHGKRLPAVELPWGVWRVDGMVSTACPLLLFYFRFGSLCMIAHWVIVVFLQLQPPMLKVSAACLRLVTGVLKCFSMRWQVSFVYTPEDNTRARQQLAVMPLCVPGRSVPSCYRQTNTRRPDTQAYRLP